MAIMNTLTLDELRSRATVSVEEAGALLGLGRVSAYEAAKRGDLPTIRIGRRIVVSGPGLLRMVDPGVTSQPGDLRSA